MTTWDLPDIDSAVCTRCGKCVPACPHGVLVLGPDGPRFVRPEACTYCGVCEGVCPEGAVALTYTIEWASSTTGLDCD